MAMQAADYFDFTFLDDAHPETRCGFVEEVVTGFVDKGGKMRDIRHDFAHRARAAGQTLEEVAYYLGHVTKKGTPAIQTTARYTQVSRERLKDKLRLISG
jgi:hypothetical protein